MAYDAWYGLDELRECIAAVSRCPKCRSEKVDVTQLREITSALVVLAQCADCGQQKQGLAKVGASQWAEWS